MDNKSIVSILRKTVIHHEDQDEIKGVIENGLGCDIYTCKDGWQVSERADQTPPTAAGAIFLASIEGRSLYSLVDVMIILIDIMTEQLEMIKHENRDRLCASARADY